jgi:hypothetical protein
MLGRNSLVYQVVSSLPRARRGKIAQAANPDVPPNPLSQLFLGIVILSTSFALLALAALVGTKLLNPGGYPDPFVPYEYLLDLPGASATVLNHLPCQASAFPPHLNQSWCDFTLDSEHFRYVSIGGEFVTVTQVLLTVDSLQVVDLVQRWGPPQRIQQSSQVFIISWDSGLVAYCALGRRFHYQLEVKTLLFQAV